MATRLSLDAVDRRREVLQGSSAEYEKTGYGTPSDGNFANCPKNTVKTTIVKNGWSERPAHADESACSAP